LLKLSEKMEWNFKMENSKEKKTDDILNAVKTAKEMFTTLDKFNIKMLKEERQIYKSIISKTK